MFEREMKFLRTEIAVKICEAEPLLYSKVKMSRYDLCRSTEEKTRYIVLQKLIEAEPSIKAVLEFYEVKRDFSELSIFDITPDFFSTDES
jgi:hypothetical protein